MTNQNVRPISELQRRPIETVLAGLRTEGENTVSKQQSIAAGSALAAEAAEFGMNMRDFLTYGVDLRASEAGQKYGDLSGYEATLAALGLPVAEDKGRGIMLEAASDTFQTFPGTRALFPEVVDDILRWQDRSGGILLENTADVVSNTRTINGAEILSTIVLDDSAERDTNTIAEGGRIPVHTIRSSQNTVGMFKHGSGYRTSYEFNRRVRLDLLTPFANRVARELTKSKMASATAMLINGDSIYSAATVVNSYDYATTVAGVLNYEALLRWLTDRARVGTPVDTVIGNFKAYVDWILLFTPTLNGNQSEAAALASAGGPALATVAALTTGVNFVLSSTVPDNQLVGITKGETLEELVEAGSTISESQQAILNQTISYVRTENTGYKLTFGDTRSIFDYSAAAA